MRKALGLLVAVILLTLAGCGGGTATTTRETYWPTQGWRTAEPADQDMDAAKLEEITTYVQSNGLAVDSVLVVRGGYLVYEKYLRLPWDAGMLHPIHSITKSVTSALVGIAIDDGHIKSLDDRMVDYFTDRTIQNLDERKQSITLRHLMTMKGGFDWQEWTYSYSDPRNPWIQALRSPDTVQFVLDRPMATQPGSVWSYNGGYSQLFSAIITQKTGMGTLDYANQNLFGPLGITEVRWNQDRQGIYDAGGGLQMFPRDMAKFGLLYLHNGKWDGRQIVPADFVAESVKTHTSFTASSGYGYESWWTYPLDDYYYAAGLNGQRIYIVPEKDLVVVVTSTIPEDSQLEGKMRTIAQYAISACE